MFPLFPLGQIVATPGAQAALERSKQPLACFLARHAIGDCGELEPADVAETATRQRRPTSAAGDRERGVEAVASNRELGILPAPSGTIAAGSFGWRVGGSRVERRPSRQYPSSAFVVQFRKRFDPS